MERGTVPYGAKLPDGWGTSPLKYLASLANGYVFNSQDWKEHGTPIIRIENLNGSRDFNYSDSELGATYKIIKGDLLFSWSGNPGTSFGPYRWTLPGDFYLNQHIFKMGVFGCDKDWLFWALKAATHWIERELTSGMIGMVHVTKEDLKNVPIPIPPLDEQRRIADFLDAETAQIDALTSLRRKQLALLDERYAAKISELTTPRITLNGKRNTLWPWLPAEIPTRRLGYVARVQSGVTVHSGRDKSEDDAEFPYLRVANVQDERVDLTEVKTIRIPPAMARRSTLQKGDVVMTEANGNPDNLGRGAVWRGEIADMVHQNHVFSIRVDQEKLSADYLTALLASTHGRRYFRFTSSQVGIATTSSSKVLDFPIPVCDLSQQHQLVAQYNSVRETTTDARRALTRQFDLLSEHRQALITAAVTGRLDVTTAGRSTSSGGTA
ncbi:restriction endonuclease subunit S [Streptomyces sp. NPDC091027]|uniref:restriction endonuclease subunit S n=1 Tax=Streptomyces sp. NPDC091027 TaxID=3365971 RepID=UPI00382ED727